MIGPFRGYYRFLSNFYPARVTFGGKEYRTVEHAYQAAKMLEPEIQEEIRKIWRPGEAKAFAKGFPLRPDWLKVRVAIMKDLVWQKFTNDPELAEKLLETEDEELVELNWWHDNFWGSCTCSRCRGKEKQNNLGKILMEVRERLRKATENQ